MSDAEAEMEEAEMEKPFILEMPVDVTSVVGETITMKLVVQGASQHVSIVYMHSLGLKHSNS